MMLRGCEHRPALRPTPQMGIEARFWIRVLLLDDRTECTIEVPSAFRITPAGADLGTSATGNAWEALPDPTRISLVDGRLALGASRIPGPKVVLCPESPHVFGLNGRQYRGRLELIVRPDGRSFEAINLVPLEPYLAGVVGREMPSSWEPQALRAQAIAARTYALFTKNRFGAGRNYDVRRTQASQVYGGLAAESPQAWEAVDHTCGQVLVALERTARSLERADLGSQITDDQAESHPPSEDRNPRPYGLFPAYYSSTCGGHTSSSATVFGDSFGPLRAVACPYCRGVARPEDLDWPTVSFDRATVTRRLLARYPKLGALGEITDLRPVEQSSSEPFSRLSKIRLTGSTGQMDTLRAEDLRLTLDPSGRKIKSTACRIVPWGDGWAFVSGRGWGHGVGMCQCGAQGMARQGRDAEDILQHYYPGAELVNVY
jgi:stage II sporulation protein D